MAILSDADKQRIEAAVTTAEQKTAAEFVVVSVACSDAYAGVRWFAAALFALAAIAALALAFPVLRAGEVLGLQLLLVVVAIGLLTTFSSGEALATMGAVLLLLVRALSYGQSLQTMLQASNETAPFIEGIEEEIRVLPSLQTKIFYDWNMRDDPDWIDRAIKSLSDTVYITIDLDGIDPAVMPAVGTPEPGGLSWRELTTLLRQTFERKRVVACDVVELCPIPGLVAPNFIAARLVYKLLSYRFGLRR